MATPQRPAESSQGPAERLSPDGRRDAAYRLLTASRRLLRTTDPAVAELVDVTHELAEYLLEQPAAAAQPNLAEGLWSLGEVLSEHARDTVKRAFGDWLAESDRYTLELGHERDELGDAFTAGWQFGVRWLAELGTPAAAYLVAPIHSCSDPTCSVCGTPR